MCTFKINTSQAVWLGLGLGFRLGLALEQALPYFAIRAQLSTLISRRRDSMGWRPAHSAAAEHFFPIWMGRNVSNSLTALGRYHMDKEVATNTGRRTFSPWATNTGKNNRQISTFHSTGSASCLSLCSSFLW